MLKGPESSDPPLHTNPAFLLKQLGKQKGQTGWDWCGNVNIHEAEDLSLIPQRKKFPLTLPFQKWHEGSTYSFRFLYLFFPLEMGVMNALIGKSTSSQEIEPCCQVGCLKANGSLRLANAGFLCSMLVGFQFSWDKQITHWAHQLEMRS